VFDGLMGCAFCCFWGLIGVGLLVQGIGQGCVDLCFRIVLGF